MADQNESPVLRSDYPNDNAAPQMTADQLPLWEQADIVESRWNKYYPYQLLVVKAVVSPDGTVSYQRVPGFIYTLPISPQELSIDMPIATTVQATLGGIAEIHGGAPFRDITLSGTTGITPMRKKAQPGPDATFVPGIFAGTADAITRTANAASALTGVGNGSTAVHDPTTGPGPNQIAANSTGYYQYQLLERFIESYVALKSRNQTDKTYGDTRLLRLALAVWKDDAVYLCAGVRLTKKKTATDPNLVNFTLQLKAWARVKLQGSSDGTFIHTFLARDPNLLAQALNRLNAVQSLITNAQDVLHAVVNEAAQAVTETIRQSVLFMKVISGAPQTLFDFPETIQREALPIIVQNWPKLRTRLSVPPDPNLDAELSSASAAGGAYLYDNSGLLPFGGGTTQQFASGTASTYGQGGARDKALTNLFGSINPSAISLAQSTIRLVNNERARVKGFARIDFQTMGDNLNQVATQYAFAIGMGDATYAQTYNLAVTQAAIIPTDTQIDVMMALNETAIILDHLAASGQIDPSTPTSLEYVAGLAEKSGIAFKIPQSKFAIPFPYGFTLEKLAAQYLGDANRWHEIATLNGLREPYVDEVGFTLPLLTNGSGNQITVADGSNLYQGQTVYLSSSSVPRQKLHIVKIDPVTTNYFLITLDSTTPLNSLTTLQSAVLESFLPGTVNSGQVLYIPSSNPVTADPETIAVPGVNAFDPLLQVGGMDLLLTPSGDLAITPDGDCRLAYGLTNIIQTIRIGLTTPRGGLLQHPDYGLDIPVGTSTADVSAQDLVRLAKEMFQNDPTFTGVRNASVLKEGNTVYLSLEIGIAGNGQYIPITVLLNR